MQADKNLDEPRNISYKRLVLSFLLTILKMLARLSANSTLLLTDAVRSFSGSINEYTKLLGFSIASRPQDKSHNYGDGKITTIYMGAGAFILLAGFHALFLSSGKLIMFLQCKEAEIPEMAAFLAAIPVFVLGSIITALTESPEIRVQKSLKPAGFSKF